MASTASSRTNRPTKLTDASQERPRYDDRTGPRLDRPDVRSRRQVRKLKSLTRRQAMAHPAPHRDRSCWFWARATARSAARWPSSSPRRGSQAGRSRGSGIRSVDDFPAAPEVVEDADTFAGNARKKASELARALSHWVIADDSGLAVDALWARQASFRRGTPVSPPNDEANNRKVSRPRAKRPTIAAARPFAARWRWLTRRNNPARGRGCLPRAIDPRARGPAGFGYDPLFLIPEYHKTFGELSPLVKHQLSHRARAFALLRRGLERMIVARRP